MDTAAHCVSVLLFFALLFMPKPVSRILLVTDDKHWLKPACNGLSAAARALDNPLGIQFAAVAEATLALDLVVKDGDVQAVLIDAALGHGAAAQDARTLVRAVRDTRPELDVYLLVQGSRDEAQ